MRAEREIVGAIKTATDITFFPFREVFGAIGEANKEAFQKMIAARIHEATITYLRSPRRH